MYIQREGSLKQIGGGTSKELEERVSVLKSHTEELERKLNAVENNHATAEAYGLARISRSTGVTEDNGLVLGASEKNAAVKGSLANAIETKFSALEEWEDFSSSFYAEGGRNTKYEYINLFYNRALRVAVLALRCGVTGNPRTWANGEVIYKNNRLKSYSSRIILNGFVIGTSRALETYQLNMTKGDGYYFCQGLNSQGGTFTEAQHSAVFLNAVIE